MLKKIWSITIYSSKVNVLIFSVILGLVLISPIPVFGQSMDYRVGPGDVLYISVWGYADMGGQVAVGPDGTIMFPQPVGSLYVNQMTADEIAQLLTQKLEEYVKQPVVSVSIRSMQGFVVHVLGQVIRPSFYRIPEGTTLQEAITEAGGLTELAIPESIILYRKTDERVEKQIIDFSQFLEQSDMESNPILENEDVVVVPGKSVSEKVSQSVTVIGEIANPGSYELDEPMPLLDVLTMAGGVSRNSDLRKVAIISRPEEGESAYRQANIEAAFSELGGAISQMPIVYPGETVFVPIIGLLEKRTFPVNVTGQVVRSGSYQLSEGMRLVDAIFSAGGFGEEASIDDIIVIHEGPPEPILSKYSLRSYLRDGNMNVNPVLRERDTIVVPVMKTARNISPVQMAFSESIDVSVIGSVQKPAVYQMPVNSTLLDALPPAGGPTSDADLKRAMLISGKESGEERRLLIDLEEVIVEGKLELLPTLSSGDIILIPKAREKRDYWRTLISAARDVIVILSLIYYVGRLST